MQRTVRDALLTAMVEALPGMVFLEHATTHVLQFLEHLPVQKLLMVVLLIVHVMVHLHVGTLVLITLQTNAVKCKRIMPQLLHVLLVRIMEQVHLRIIQQQVAIPTHRQHVLLGTPT